MTPKERHTQRTANRNATHGISLARKAARHAKKARLTHSQPHEIGLTGPVYFSPPPRMRGPSYKQLLASAVRFTRIVVIERDGTEHVAPPRTTPAPERRRGVLLTIMLLLALLCSQSIAQEKERGRGYVPSPFNKALRENSHKKHGPTLKRLAEVPLPATYETPYQIPQQDQGNCGSCWDVSGCIIVSCAHVQAGNAKGDGSFVISADTVMWCYSTGGCSGDDASTVMRIAEKDGLPINADVGEYKATGRGTCNKTAKRYKIDAWGYADTNGDGISTYEEIKTCIFKYGACICTNDANGLIDGEAVSTKRGRGTDHQIIYVAWDDTKVGPGYKGALLCKNQWGDWGFEHNGQKGYCWLAAFPDGTIAASGSEEVIWCQVNGTAPPAPPAPVPAPPLLGSLFVEKGIIIRGELTTGKFSYVPTPDGFTAAGVPKFKFIQLAE